MFLANLGIALRLRFRHRHHRRDLRAATSACRRAVEGIEAYRLAARNTPADPAEIAHIRGNLGTELADRYDVAGDPRMAALVMEQYRAVLRTLAVEDLDRMGRPDLAGRYRRAAATLARSHDARTGRRFRLSCFRHRAVSGRIVVRGGFEPAAGRPQPASRAPQRIRSEP